MKYTFNATKKLTTLIRAQNFSLDSLQEGQVQQLTEKWLSRLQDTLFLQGPGKIVVEMLKDKDGYKAKLDVSLKFHQWLGDGTAWNPLTALIKAYENLRSNDKSTRIEALANSGHSAA